MIISSYLKVIISVFLEFSLVVRLLLLVIVIFWVYQSHLLGKFSYFAYFNLTSGNQHLKISYFILYAAKLSST